MSYMFQKKSSHGLGNNLIHPQMKQVQYTTLDKGNKKNNKKTSQ